MLISVGIWKALMMYLLLISITYLSKDMSMSCIGYFESSFAMIDVNGVGFTQLARLGGRIYLELLVYIIEASTLGFPSSLWVHYLLPSGLQLSVWQFQAFMIAIFPVCFYGPVIKVPVGGAYIQHSRDVDMSFQIPDVVILPLKRSFYTG
ncbi:hypothetical protein Tco_1028748 [Tanacetum coccineum]|uniref:Uncharacterized protein n=1 Tax=Tanacetum coccineum TaxID=301880 RepID=A0ABQ5G399_9ASTR